MNYFHRLLDKAYKIRDSEDSETTAKELATSLIQLNEEYKILCQEYEELKVKYERDQK